MKSILVEALSGNETKTIPVWFMRQAGRYLPQYMEIRNNLSIKEIAADPDISAEISYAPVKEIGVDAAIVFSDIMLPAESMGFDLEYRENVGPVIGNPIKEGIPREVNPYDPSRDRYNPSRAISAFRKSHGDTPIIGFCGGPMTIASYLFAGTSDRELSITRRKWASDPETVMETLKLVTEAVIRLAKDQVKNGADAIQIFDSWATSLNHTWFREYFDMFVGDIPSELSSDGVPVIYFTLNSAQHLNTIKDSKFDCLSVDWKQDISAVSAILGPRKSVQGNLDPEVARAGGPGAISMTRRILESMKNSHGFVFNLGHGVLPGTDPQVLRSVAGEVHGFRR